MDITGAAKLGIMQVLLNRYEGSTIQVDTEAMVSKADQVSGAISKMESSFDELQRIVAKTNGYWVGEAAEHYRMMFHDEKENISRILKRLEEHPSDLKIMAVGYGNTEIKLQQENQRLQSDYI